MKMNVLKTTLLTLCMAAATAAEAQIPQGYYDALKGKKGAALKNAVNQVIGNANVLDYGSGSGHTWDGFYTTDRTDDNEVIDRYSNEKRYFGKKGASVSGMNIEHSFPKSWWGGDKTQAYKDLYNLMPCEQKINSAKSNYPMGKVVKAKTDNGATKVGTGSNGYMLWEPADRWKGDFARGYMYMATAYQSYTWKGDQANEILEKGDYPTLQPWAYKLYIEWAKADTVDQTEALRNEAVSKIQGNRNPFVDFPNLMEYIWGDSTDYAFDPATTVKTVVYNGGGGGTTVEPGEETVYTATFTTDDGGFNTTDSRIWKRDAKYGWKGTGYLSGKATEADASLTSPEIDLTGYASATLSFNHAVNFAADPSAVLTVEIESNGTTTGLNDKVAWPKGDSWTFKASGDIDLTAWAGSKCRITFHYTSTTAEAATWEIKDLTVKGVKKAADGISTPAVSYRKDTRTYDLNGRLVKDGEKKAGIYIVGGRKVIVTK